MAYNRNPWSDGGISGGFETFLVSVVFVTANWDPDHLVRIHMLCHGKSTLNFTTDEAAVDCW